mgnify:CR=1 FL=1
MIDYTAWRPPRYESATEPAVLTTSQRRVFWGIVRGMSLVQLADELECSVRTIQSHNISIHERIPGLLNFAAYGLLAAEIMKQKQYSLDGDVLGKARQWESLTQEPPSESSQGMPAP